MASRAWGRYEELRPHQIDAIKREIPLAYVPWGALEWHSYHNPIGLDGLKAHALCECMARKTGGVVLPTFFAGTDTIKPFKGFGHTLDHKADTVRALMTEVLEQLIDEHFKVIVLLTGHYGGGHVAVMEEVCASVQQRHPEVGLWGMADWMPLDGIWPANHAAHGETSFLLHFHPNFVELNQLPEDRATTLDEDGVWGDDPREATGDAGEIMTADFLTHAVPQIEALLKRHAGC